MIFTLTDWTGVCAALASLTEKLRLRRNYFWVA